MEVKLDLGATIDVATGQQVADGFESVGGLLRKKGPKPNFYTRAVSMTTQTAEVFGDLGFPPAGKMWNVFGITLVGSDDSTAVASAKVALYFGDSDTPALTSCKVPGLTVPSFTSITKGVLWCYSSENVVAGVSGAAAGLQVLAMVHLAEWNVEDVLNNSGK